MAVQDRLSLPNVVQVVYLLHTMMRLPSALLALALVVAGLPAAISQTACTTGLCLQQVSCPTGQTTSITGTIYAPNGLDPLPNVLVYIPNAPVDAFQAGVQCPVVGQPPSGSPIVGVTTNFDGTFTITNVPVGANIPLVVQTGRWRRQVVIPLTTACVDTAFNTRMPRNKTEGDIPKIAVSTGSADSVECVLRKVGIDDSEFTDATGPGRINIYAGSGAPGAVASGGSTLTQADLMSTSAALNAYDVLMLPCEGSPYPGAKSAAEYANLVSFANAGGRVYASHFSYQWMAQNAPFDTVAKWAGGSGSLADNLPATVNTSFSEGKTLAQWLQVVGASTTPGQITVSAVRRDISGINPPTQSYLALNSNGAVMQFVWDTPVGATANQCGRVLFDEYHVENPSINSPGKVFPAECPNTSMNAQEKLLEFSLFALTADGNAASLTPLTQDFGSEPINFSTATQAFTWTNHSTFSASVNLVTTTGDFAVASSNCAAVAAGASCTINVYFKPTAVGARTGTVTVGSNGSTLVASLTGTGVPDLVFSLNALNFGSLDVGQSLTQSFTVTNNASGPVNVPPLSVTGDYSTANTCGSSIAALGVCSVSVTFKPSVYGPRPGVLSVNSTDPAYPQMPSALTGNGVDFSVVMMPTSGTTIAGYGSKTAFTTTPLGGFSANLVVTCTTNAPGSTCTLSSGGYTATNAVTTNVAITTTAKYAVVGYGGFGGIGWLWIAGLGSGAMLFVGRRRLHTVVRAGVVMLLIAAGTASLSGCSGKLPAVNANATLPGNYTYTITATDGILSRSATYMLNVTVK